MDGRPGRLAGKAALITGAASGIGRATALLFHAEGAKVAATDRNEAGLAELKGVADLILAQDVTDEARWREVVDRVVAAFGKLDILVNSAGIALKGNIETATLDDFRRTEAVNIDGTFLGCREAIRVMKGSGGGSIVNLSSVAGIIGDAQSAAYCASKGAVRLLTKSAALHCGRAGYNIRLNSVHPSFADTPMVQAADRKLEEPGPRPRGPDEGRAAGPDGPAGGGRQRHPLSRERRIVVHHGRRADGRRRADRAMTRKRNSQRRAR